MAGKRPGDRLFTRLGLTQGKAAQTGAIESLNEEVPPPHPNADRAARARDGADAFLGSARIQSDPDAKVRWLGTLDHLLEPAVLDEAA